MIKQCCCLPKIAQVKLLLSLFSLVVVLSACSLNDTKTAEKPTKKKIEITLSDAAALGQKEADKHYKDLKLTEIHSYDNDETREEKAGKNGKRQWWNVNFANEAANYVSVLIADNEIVDVQAFDENGNTGSFSLADIKITSDQAVEKAGKLGLRGGDPQQSEEWVSGYNFKLSYGSLATAPEDKKLLFEVIGISSKGHFAHVDFDGRTGEPLLAEEEVDNGSGGKKWQPMTK